jgi:hypothetical protein
MSFPTSRPSIFPSVLLWAEVAGLLVGVLFFKLLWLLPLAALVMLIACLLHARPATGVLLALAALIPALVFRSEWAPVGLVGPGLAVGALVSGAVLSFAGILAATKAGAWPPLWRCLLRLLVVIHFICAGVLLAAQ